ncbi:MAG: translation initiation factor IF-3 [Candidatus Heimdallarchaeota archaeon]
MRKTRSRKFVPPIKQYPHRINEKIRVDQIRLVGDNVEVQLCTPSKALYLAKEVNLDLVEISPNAIPPVCKILDYSKFLFDQRKREKQNKKNSAQNKIKEIKFGPYTDDHDFDFKLKHAKNFLEKGHKVKAVVQFKGRQLAHKEIGEILLLKLLQALEEHAKVEQLPKMEGRRMSTLMSPKVKKTK